MTFKQSDAGTTPATDTDVPALDDPGLNESRASQSVCYRCLVGGRVQGVFFRGAAREQAMRLEITGYARNLADGRVEILACGEAQAVAHFRDWLRSGPPAAEVTGVACEPLDYQSYSGFVTD